VLRGQLDIQKKGAFMNGLEDDVRAVVKLHNIGNLGSMIKLIPRVDEHNNLPKKGEDGSDMRT
jgi:hypothetical protein